MSHLHRPNGTLTHDDDPVLLTPDAAGWTYSGLRVLRLGAGETRTFTLDGVEAALLPLSGGVQAEVDGKTYPLAGRASVFAGVTDWLYLPLGSTVRLSADAACELAVPTAVATEAFPVAYVPATEVPVEVRGSGQSTRQLNNFAAPETFAGAGKLMAVEVLTPDGNWSSYPPHKHDDSPECDVNLEEIYYFRIGRTGTTEYAPEGFGLHRTYTGDPQGAPGALDENVTVRDGDVFLIPRGYHGPCVAAPGYPMYYLNALAGPGGERSMAFCDDPAHHWIRGSWDDQPLDPRCPMTTAADGGRGDAAVGLG